MPRRSLLFLFLAVALPIVLHAQSAVLVTGTPTFGNTGNTFFAFLPITNAGSADASSMELTSVSLTHVGTVVSDLELPVSLPFQPGTGFLGAGGTRTLNLEFSNSKLSNGSTYILKVNGTYQVNGKTLGFSLNRPLLYKSGMTATHSQVTQLILQKANCLPDTDKSTQNQIMLKFVSGLPLVSKAGIAPNNALVWILFSDTGRKFLFLNNDFLEAPGSSAATSAAVRGAEPNPQTVSFKPTALKAASVSSLDASPATELPISNKVRILNGMGAGVSTANANLSDWLIGKQGYVSSGGDMSLNSLRTIGGDGVLYIGSHGGVDDPDDTPFNIWTTSPTDDCEAVATNHPNASCADPILEDDLKNDRVTGMLAKNSFDPATKEFVIESHYAIYATAFALKYWKHFGGNALVYIDTCDSQSSAQSVQEFKATLASLGASVYAGWTDSQRTGDGIAVARFLFDRLLGANSFCPENGQPCALGSASPPFFAQRAFDWQQARSDMSIHGLGLSLIAEFGIESIGGSLGLLAPSISFMEVNEFGGSSGQLTINGSFGTDPRTTGGTAVVTIGDEPAHIASWAHDHIIVDLDFSGPRSFGDVQVIARNHKSNVARLTQWISDQYNTTISANGSLQLTEKHNLHFRADIRKYRTQIHSEPIEPKPVTFAALDSTATYSASGAGNGIGEIFKWSGSGSMVYVNPQNVPITGVTIFYAALQFADSTHAQAFVVGESEAKAGGTCTVIITSDGSSQTSLLPIVGPSSFAAYLFKSQVDQFSFEFDKDSAQIKQGIDTETGKTEYDCTAVGIGIRPKRIFSWGPVSAGSTAPDPKSAR